MPYSAELKAAFKDSKIKRIAIVDDAYDVVDFAKIEYKDVVSVSTVLRELLEDSPHSPAIDLLEKAAGISLDQIVKRLAEEAVQTPLWELYVDAEPSSEIRNLLRPLYLTLGVDKADKLRPLRKLKTILKKTTGVDAIEFNSDAQPADVVDYDLIFLDFYLSDEVPAHGGPGATVALKDNARKRSIQFLEKVVQLAEAKAETKTPLVMLISSLAAAEHLPEFRKSAAMLASKMAFLPKTVAETNPARAQHAIAALARHRSQADALWTFLNIWKSTVNDVAEGMMTSLRELELTDYSYMQEYRLTGEKTPMSQYVASLFSGRLTDLVERQMYEKKALQHMAQVTLEKAIPGRVSPTPAITEIYSSMTTSQVPVAEGKFKPRAWAGDIFIDIASYNEAFGTTHKVKQARKALPKVLAVVTPACDLIPERSKNNPLQTVTMIGGDLVPLMETSGPSTNLLMLNQKPYAVRWNPKWPLTSGVNTMATDSALAGRYKWVARLRDLYHAELQHMLMAEVGRVGLPVPPTLPEYVSARILAKTGRGDTKYEVIADFDGASHSAWTFGASASQRAFCLRADLAWDLAAWVTREADGIGEKDREKLMRWINSPAWLDELQHPVLFKDNQSKGSKSANGISYKRALKPFDDLGAGDATAFVVVFGTKPDVVPDHAANLTDEPATQTAA